jgi:hypothetical protein
VLVNVAAPARAGGLPVALLTAYFDTAATAKRAAAAVAGIAKDPKRSEAVRRVAGLLKPEVRGATLVADIVPLFDKLDAATMSALQAEVPGMK